MEKNTAARVLDDDTDDGKTEDGRHCRPNDHRSSDDLHEIDAHRSLPRLTSQTMHVAVAASRKASLVHYLLRSSGLSYQPVRYYFTEEHGGATGSPRTLSRSWKWRGRSIRRPTTIARTRHT